MSTVFDQTFDALAVDKANSRLTIRVWAEENAGALIWKAQCAKAETLLYGSGGYGKLRELPPEIVRKKRTAQAEWFETVVYIWVHREDGRVIRTTNSTPPSPLYALDHTESGEAVSYEKTKFINDITYVYLEEATGRIIKSKTRLNTSGSGGSGSGSYAYGNEPVSFQLKIDDQVSEIAQGIQKVNAHSQWNAGAGWFTWEDGRGTDIIECRSASPWADRRAFLTIYDGALGSRDILLFGDGADYSMSEDERLAHGHIFLRTRAGWKVIL